MDQLIRQHGMTTKCLRPARTFLAAWACVLKWVIWRIQKHVMWSNFPGGSWPVESAIKSLYVHFWIDNWVFFFRFLRCVARYLGRPCDVRASLDPSSPTLEAAVEWQGKVLMRLASQDVFMIFYTHLAISKCWWLISWSCSHMITLINTCLSTFRSARSGTCWFKRNHLPSQSPQCKPTCGWPISGGALQIMYCVRRHDFCRLGVLCSLDWFYHLMMTQSQCKIWAESETKSNFNFRALRQIGVLEFQQLVIVFVSIVNVGAYPVVMNDLNLNDFERHAFPVFPIP